MGMKANSGFFHGTLGSSYLNSSKAPEKYSSRNIEVPGNVKSWMESLKRKGDVIESSLLDFSATDVSVLSKETGVEYAKVTIGNKAYLIRGDENGTDIPISIIEQIKNKNGVLEFHSHPFDDDLIASVSDRNMMTRLYKITGQTTSKIVTPNGKVSVFGKDGVIEISSVSNSISKEYAEALKRLFGGTTDDNN